MTKLRKAFTDFLTLHRYSPKTVEAYLLSVKGLAFHYNISPDKLSNSQIQKYLQYLIEEKKYEWSSCNVVLCGIKCFYDNIVQRDTTLVIPPRPRSKKLPEILSQKEVSSLLNSVTNVKHYTILLAVYSAGLRVSEVATLRPWHIERERGLIRVEQAKGRKDRYTVLSSVFSDALKAYIRLCQPDQWLFFGRDKNTPVSVSTVQKIFSAAKTNANIQNVKGIHTLRHCFATHLIEQGVDIQTIQRMMGHRYLSTTAGYIHISNDRIRSVISPMDTLCFDSCKSGGEV